MRIGQLMTKNPTICRADDTLSEAAWLMWQNDCGCLPVTSGDEARRLLGMITDRDICMAAHFQGELLKNLRVKDAMARDVRACNAEDLASEALEIMREARLRRLPVLNESEQLVGVLSLSDFAREAARERTSSWKEITYADIGRTMAHICEREEIGGAEGLAEPQPRAGS